MKSLRVKNRTLQTAIWEFEHPVTGSQIALVGTIHVGTREYYQYLKDWVLCCEHNGAQVHYELSRKPSKEELAAADEEVRECFEQLKRNGNWMGSELAKEYGLVQQGSKELGFFEPTWLNYDLTILEMLSLRSTRDFVNQSEEIREFIQESFAELHPTTRRRLFNFYMRIMPYARFLQRVDKKARERGKNTVVLRDKVALIAAYQALAANIKQHLVLLWGAGHLPGLAKGFTEFGYVRTNVIWVDAFKL